MKDKNYDFFDFSRFFLSFFKISDFDFNFKNLRDFNYVCTYINITYFI